MIFEVSGQNQVPYPLLRSFLKHLNGSLVILLFSMHKLLTLNIAVVSVVLEVLQKWIATWLTSCSRSWHRLRLREALEIRLITRLLVIVTCKLLVEHRSHLRIALLHVLIGLIVLLLLLLLKFNLVLPRLIEHFLLLSYQFLLRNARLTLPNIIAFDALGPRQSLLILGAIDSLEHDIFLLLKGQFGELGFGDVEGGR